VSSNHPLQQPSWKAEIPLLVGALSGGAAILGHGPAAASAGPASIIWSLWIVACLVASAVRAMAHADRLAERFGEPVGTIVLTIAAITIEVASVCAMMLGDGGSDTAARDSMFAVIMLILNGLVGGCILVGTWRSGERRFNADSASAYLPLIIALGTLTMVLPRFCDSTIGGYMSDPMEIFVAATSIVVYGGFLWLQVSRYRGYFATTESPSASAAHHTGPVHVPSAILLLFGSLVVVVLCADAMAGRVPSLLRASGSPPAIGGVLIAAMVLFPEGLAALKASARGDMQRSINVLLGSAGATIGLTVPAVLAVRALTGKDPELGLETPYIVLLVLTFLVSTINLMRGRVNMIQGIIHLLIMLAWVMTIYDDALPSELP
jgi:Ca2+:H+ antiporter